MKPGAEIKSGFALTEEALSVLLHTPVPALAQYVIGTVPFLAGLLVYWATMASSAIAQHYQAAGALGLALLFVWMKVWQARFMQGQLAHLQDRVPVPWTAGQALRIAARQALVQSSGFFTLPIALILLLPAPWAYGFYQHVSVLDDGKPVPLRDFLQRASTHASRMPRQTLVAVWLLCPLPLLFTAVLTLALLPLAMHLASDSASGFLSMVLMIYGGLFGVLLVVLCPFSFMVLFNLLISSFTLLYLAYTLFGVQHQFVTGAAAYNDVFFAAIYCLAYLLVDPLSKTAFVLRTFDTESRTSGLDLHLALRRVRGLGTLLLLAATACFAGPAAAQLAAPASTPQAIDSSALDRALAEELRDPVYQWRMPRVESDAEKGVLSSIAKVVVENVKYLLDWIGDRIKELVDWIFSSSTPEAGMSIDTMMAIGAGIKILLLLCCIALAAALLVLVYRFLRDTRNRQVPVADTTSFAAPDLAAEETTADALPEEGWLQLAQELLARGERRLAQRALFLALLATLARRELIKICRAKTNHDYTSELRRRAHVAPGALAGFQESAGVYEASWYGDHPVTDQGIQRLLQLREALSNHV